jgi:hypothetical protein
MQSTWRMSSARFLVISVPLEREPMPRLRVDPVSFRMLPRAIATANVDVDRDSLGSCSRLAHDGRRPDGTGRHQMTRDDT